MTRTADAATRGPDTAIPKAPAPKLSHGVHPEEGGGEVAGGRDTGDGAAEDEEEEKEEAKLENADKVEEVPELESELAGGTYD